MTQKNTNDTQKGRQKPIHGGARKGAGRKKLNPDEKLHVGTIRLPPHLWDLAREIGDGNASEGIRETLEALTTPT